VLQALGKLKRSIPVVVRAHRLDFFSFSKKNILGQIAFGICSTSRDSQQFMNLARSTVIRLKNYYVFQLGMHLCVVWV
jgi:hypothetical protein